MLIDKPMFNVEERVNLSWFYPNICRFQDKPGEAVLVQEIGQHLSMAGLPSLLYIHIPFCESFCAYCGCFKESARSYNLDQKKQYVDSVIREAQLYIASEKQFNQTIEHIHLGGGTPTCLGYDNIERLINGVRNIFGIKRHIRISIEANVMSLHSAEQLDALHHAGVTRVSFGVQTFNEKIRKILAIKAKIEAVYHTAQLIQDSKIQNFAIDLMYNLPEQHLKDFIDDISRAVTDIRPTYIQFYRLNEFHNTNLYRNINNGFYTLSPSNERELVFTQTMMDLLPEKGFGNHMLINIFSRIDNPEKTGMELSLGNNTKEGSNVIGLGAGASGYLNGFFYRNLCTVKGYIERLSKNSFPIETYNHASQELMDSRRLVFFPNFMSTRISNLPNFQEHQEIFNNLAHHGYLTIESEKVALTSKGKVWAGNISQLFIGEEQKRKIKNSFKLALKHQINPFNQDLMNVTND